MHKLILSFIIFYMQTHKNLSSEYVNWSIFKHLKHDLHNQKKVINIIKWILQTIHHELC